MSPLRGGVLRREVAIAVEIDGTEAIPSNLASPHVVLASAERNLAALTQTLERVAGLAPGVELAVRLDGQFQRAELGELCELGKRLGLAAIADPCTDLAEACCEFRGARVRLAISAHLHPPAELARVMAAGGFQVLLIDPARLNGGADAVRALAIAAELSGVEVGLVTIGPDHARVIYAAELAATLEACTWPLVVSVDTARSLAGPGGLRVGTGNRNDAAPRIAHIRFRRVSVPMRQLYVSAMYMRRTTERLFIEIETDDGQRGFGETNGMAEVVATCAEMARKLLGACPLDHLTLRRASVGPMTASRNGLRDWSAWAGLEMALFDWQGRHQNQPVFRMLGGRGTTSVEAVCHIPALILDEPVDRRDLPKLFADPGRRRQVVEHTLHQQHAGFTAFKIKSTGTCPDWDVALLRGLRAALGDSIKLRWDPNANYPPAQAAALVQRFEELKLEYYEDPTRGIAGMAQIRAHVATKLATNMCVITFDHLAHAIRQRCVDVVLADVVMWGGPQSIVDLSAVLPLLDQELTIHSAFEVGIGTAMNLQLAGALAPIRRAVDFGLENMTAELTLPRIPVERGRVRVPEGPGLGVEPDWDEVARYAMEEPVTFSQ